MERALKKKYLLKHIQIKKHIIIYKYEYATVITFVTSINQMVIKYTNKYPTTNKKNKKCTK